ncbi:MAG: DUF2442 domain-containing protein [Prevotellaceae bacterium]|jgi:hypothetical protein|nr:DUF2442 domain-containing protein [Prevotellaceae bacterium]
MIWEVKTVVPLDDYKLMLTFENNEKRCYDVKPLLETGVFKSLKEPKTFKSARVCFDTVAWNNDVDIAPETLYYDSVKV